MSVSTRIEIKLGTPNDPSGKSSLKVNLDNNRIMLPVGSPLVTDSIRSVADLYRVYGQYMSIRYYGVAEGIVPEHKGGQQHQYVSYLQFKEGCGNSQGECLKTRSNEIVLVDTLPLSSDGQKLPLQEPSEYTIKPGTPPGLPVYVDCWGVQKEGPNIFNKSIYDNGGWSQISVTLIYVIVTDMIGYCNLGSNLTSNMGCYNYFSNTISNGGGNQQMANVMQGYCARNLPNATLADFTGTSLDPKDRAVCACNMPASYYADFRKQAVGLDPRFSPAAFPTADACLFSPCSSSQFKPIALGGCPLPQCLQIVSVSSSNVMGDLAINQSAECAQYFAETADGPPAPPLPSPPPSPPASPPSSPPPSADEKSFWQKYGLYLGLGVLVILIIGIILIVLSSKKKTKRRPRPPGAPRPLPPGAPRPLPPGAPRPPPTYRPV